MALRTENVRGLIIYRAESRSGSIEYLLLKKQRQCDWSPPKGKQEGKNETELETARRETEEETGLDEQDYEMMNSKKIKFEYVKNRKIKKIVTLWPAKLVSSAKAINISDEHETSIWLPYDDAIMTIKTEYRNALNDAHSALLHQL